MIFLTKNILLKSNRKESSMEIKIAFSGIGGVGGYYGGRLAHFYRQSENIKIYFISRGENLEILYTVFGYLSRAFLKKYEKFSEELFKRLCCAKWRAVVDVAVGWSGAVVVDVGVGWSGAVVVDVAVGWGGAAVVNVAVGWSRAVMVNVAIRWRRAVMVDVAVGWSGAAVVDVAVGWSGAAVVDVAVGWKRGGCGRCDRRVKQSGWMIYGKVSFEKKWRLLLRTRTICDTI